MRGCCAAAHRARQSRLEQWDAVFLVPLLFTVNYRLGLGLATLTVLQLACALIVANLGLCDAGGGGYDGWMHCSVVLRGGVLRPVAAAGHPRAHHQAQGRRAQPVDPFCSSAQIPRMEPASGISKGGAADTAFSVNAIQHIAACLNRLDGRDPNK